jgi:HSP20 family molecular chaperone IbpA
MNEKKDLDTDWNRLMDDWLKDFFLDPLTSLLDETEFRIDVFETEKEYIVEALLIEIKKEHIRISTEEKLLTIIVLSDNDKKEEEKKRIISFPTHINEKHIQATFTNGILEVFISKQKLCRTKSTIVSIL